MLTSYTTADRMGLFLLKSSELESIFRLTSLPSSRDTENELFHWSWFRTHTHLYFMQTRAFWWELLVFITTTTGNQVIQWGGTKRGRYSLECSMELEIFRKTESQIRFVLISLGGNFRKIVYSRYFGKAICNWNFCNFSMKPPPPMNNVSTGRLLNQEFQSNRLVCFCEVFSRFFNYILSVVHGTCSGGSAALIHHSCGQNRD